MNLDPANLARTRAIGTGTIIVIESSDKTEALVLHGHLSDNHIDSGHLRWTRDGEKVYGWSELLAWRTHDGAWKVIDSRVSALLPRVDSALED